MRTVIEYFRVSVIWIFGCWVLKGGMAIGFKVYERAREVERALARGERFRGGGMGTGVVDGSSENAKHGWRRIGFKSFEGFGRGSGKVW